MAERYAAIHATRALVTELLLLHVVVKFLVIVHALQRRTVDGNLAEVFDEAGRFAHGGKV
jgi:hypothetical protein